MSATKPLLILPPAPQAWPGLADLLGQSPPWGADAERRIAHGVPNAQDAVGVVRDGGQTLSAAMIRRTDGVGVLGQIGTCPTHRRRGLARRTIAALLSWFDMTGGQRLYATASPAELSPLLAAHGFEPLHRCGDEREGVVTMRRGPAWPFSGTTPADVTVRPAQHSDFPLMVELLQHRPGADPRVALAETAAAAEQTIAGLLDEQEHGRLRLLVALHGRQAVALASVATDTNGPRTYAALLPHDDEHAGLRAAVMETAQTRGYEAVDFPMEALRPAGA